MGRKSVIKKRYVDLDLREKYTAKLLVYFQKYGLNHFSMSTLASDFNVSKTTLYNHFESKEEMIDAAVSYKLSSINDYKTVLFDKDLDYFERLRKAMLFYCVQIFEISRNLLKEVKENYPKSWFKVVKFQQQMLSELEDYYKLGQRIGHYHDEFEVDLLVANDQSFFLWLSQYYLPEKYDYDVVYIVNQYCRLKFYGIRTKTQ